MEKLTELFKALSDPIRLRIIHLLLKAGKEICSCEICDALAEPQYSVSRNIKILKYAGLVTERKEGKWVYYMPTQQPEEFLRYLYETLKLLPDSHRTLADDVRRLKKRFSIREDGKCLVGIQNKKLLG